MQAQRGTLTWSYRGNSLYCLRFENRRQRDFYTFRCSAELGPQELALANAYGSGLLRDRVNGDRCVAVRYCAIWRGSDALFAAAMRCDDRGWDSYLQNGACGEAHLRADARAEMGNRHGRMRFHGRYVPLVRYSAGNRPTYPRRCLRLWLPTASGSVASWFDEIAGENFSAAVLQGPEAGAR